MKEGVKKIPDSLRQTTDACFRTSDSQPTAAFLTTLDDCLLLVFVPVLFLPFEISKILQCGDHRISEAIGPIAQSFSSLSHSQKIFHLIFLPENAKTYFPLCFSILKTWITYISLFPTIFKGHYISCIFSIFIPLFNSIVWVLNVSEVYKLRAWTSPSGTVSRWLNL